ncbi:TetR/AcrR family transcriptional regulator [Microvirga antarctica]|uniref:TetR/AcrR family transcriptional regulator n=1 Tax=Microvirga antarctica TaxID=2819233 RepID=UPI001B301FFA|nr:TetR/AcrR family transcriptional regulator [Microvirga antarctica]
MDDVKESATFPCPKADDSGEGLKRRQILQGARNVFLAHGFDGASMGEIARAAGVSKGTLYVYFDSKEKLFEALTLEQKGVLAEVLFKLNPDNPDVRSVLVELGRTFLKFMCEPAHVSSVRMVMGAAEKVPAVGQAFYEGGPSKGIARLSAYLSQQAQAGRLTIDDPETAAEHFLALCQSETMKRLLFAVGAPPDEAQIDIKVQKAVRVFLAAYGPAA